MAGDHGDNAVAKDENRDPNPGAAVARARISPAAAVLHDSNRLEASCCESGSIEKVGSVDKEDGIEVVQSHGRRICGSKVQSLVQAFESMISVADVGTQFQLHKAGEHRSSSWHGKSKRKSLSQTEEEIGSILSCRADEKWLPSSSSPEDNAGSEDCSLSLDSLAVDRRDDKDEVQSEKNALSSDCGSSESYQKSSKARPFRLRTQARGARKEYEFRKKLQKMIEEDSKMRIPVAQGLPWTTDEPEIVPKPPPKDNTVPLEIRLCTEHRSSRRAQFDDYIAAKILYIEQQREEQQKLQELAEQEEVKQLRKEMVPRAQMMPYFDRPFIPQRSSKPLTVPKEPNFNCSHDHKRVKCCILSQ